MKLKTFVKQVQALGFQVTAVKFRDTVWRLYVQRNGTLIATINNSYACDYTFGMLWYPSGSQLLGSYKAYRQMVLFVQQLANTEVDNRGLLPDSVYAEQLDTEWQQYQTKRGLEAR